MWRRYPPRARGKPKLQEKGDFGPDSVVVCSTVRNRYQCHKLRVRQSKDEAAKANRPSSNTSTSRDACNDRIAKHVAKWSISQICMCATKYQWGGGIAPMFVTMGVRPYDPWMPAGHPRKTPSLGCFLVPGLSFFPAVPWECFFVGGGDYTLSKFPGKTYFFTELRVKVVILGKSLSQRNFSQVIILCQSVRFEGIWWSRNPPFRGLTRKKN